MPEVLVETETIQQIEARVEKKFIDLFEVWKAKELVELADQQSAEMKEEVTKLVKEFQDQQKPITVEQIQKMLEQEYVQVRIKLFVSVANYEEPQARDFVVRELPQAIERKFYRQFAERMQNEGPKLSAFAQRSMDQPFETQLQDFMQAFDAGFDILSDAVAIILNPFKKDPDVTSEWCANNISSNRMYDIIQAQVEVNKLRDFFSRVFRSGQKAGMMMMPASSRSSRGPSL